MTQNADGAMTVLPGAAPAEAPVGAPSTVSETGRSQVGRLIGVDLARGPVVFGMYAAHVGPTLPRAARQAS
ncbi:MULTISPECIES: hypothetical protein [Streptomyces]|uniref:hypothetical protein n=1 Tax=Streptomyces TaxID=1883 RepID=UPI000BD5DC5C|nr:hypothetical protein SAMN06272781_0409 [Streptomyces sp. 1222.2]